jgi:hypothetical protein
MLRSTKLQGGSRSLVPGRLRLAFAETAEKYGGLILKDGSRTPARRVENRSDPALDARVTPDPVASCSSRQCPRFQRRRLQRPARHAPKSRSRPTGADRRAKRPLNDLRWFIILPESTTVKRNLRSWGCGHSPGGTWPPPFGFSGLADAARAPFSGRATRVGRGEPHIDRGELRRLSGAGAGSGDHVSARLHRLHGHGQFRRGSTPRRATLRATSVMLRRI